MVRIKNNQLLFSAFIYSHHHNRWLPLLYTTLTTHGRHEKHGQKSRFPVDKKGSDAWQCEKKPMWYKKVQKLKSTFYSSNYVVTGHALVVWKCNNMFFHGNSGQETINKQHKPMLFFTSPLSNGFNTMVACTEGTVVLCINTAHYTHFVQCRTMKAMESWQGKCGHWNVTLLLLSVENETRAEIMLFVFENNPSAYLEGGLLNVKNSGMVGFSHQNSFAWN